MYSWQVLLFSAIAGVSSSPTSVPRDSETYRPPIASVVRSTPFCVDQDASNAGASVLESFLSYSIEFAFFTDFSGNESTPNVLSTNLLQNLGDIQGSKPHLRVGGHTQDNAIFDASLQTATEKIFDSNYSADFPKYLTIGPLFFDAYKAWANDVKFIHGFNLNANKSADAKSVIESVQYACKAIGDNLLYWEMGNEPDLFSWDLVGRRPPSYDESDYIQEWTQRVDQIKVALQENCGSNWTSPSKFQWIAPSFAGQDRGLNTVKSWNTGLNARKEIKRFAAHNYMGASTNPGVTLAGYLMNHTRVVSVVGVHYDDHSLLQSAGMELDYILGECNSLSRQGAPALSNSFGAALWGVDFNLYAASRSIRKVHMHMGTDYRYASWQPIATNRTSMGTKAPYYGNIAVASALGNITNADTQVQNIDLESEKDAAYAIYSNNKLERLMVINFNQYNFSVPEPAPRPEVAYSFTLPPSCAGTGSVHRLMANGSDAITGITFDGFSYNYELDQGKPYLMKNTTRDEKVKVGKDGLVTVNLPWSSAALLQLEC